MSLADELLADLDEVGEEVNEEEMMQDEEIMDAATEQLEDLAKMADKSVRAVAKLGESKEVRTKRNRRDCTLLNHSHSLSPLVQ